MTFTKTLGLCRSTKRAPTLRKQVSNRFYRQPLSTTDTRLADFAAVEVAQRIFTLGEPTEQRRLNSQRHQIFFFVRHSCVVGRRRKPILCSLGILPPVTDQRGLPPWHNGLEASQ